MGLKTGPKTKSKDVKLLKGERKDRINFAEPTAIPIKTGDLPPARFVEDRQKELWYIFIDLLNGLCVIGESDRPALEELVYQKWLSEKAEAEVLAKGFIVEQQGGTGQIYEVENPWLAVKNKAHDRVMKCLTQFGLTPSSRTSVSKIIDEKKPAGIAGLIKMG